MPEPLTPRPADTPAVLLGPAALTLGVVSVTPAFVLLASAALAFLVVPWAVVAGALAVVLGATGVHHARRGNGRTWTAVAGTALGVVGFVGTAAVFWVSVPTASP
ncbi:hypothetical protein ACFUIW_19240 [Streptomyces sp. NPDC057245]|uniref:hypothetical protein n=1 Tax=Streptomyces sp. NPDC057245 TaxID=3346065 RepID=UPI003641F289